MFLLVMQASFGAYQPRSWHGGKEEREWLVFTTPLTLAQGMML